MYWFPITSTDSSKGCGQWFVACTTEWFDWYIMSHTISGSSSWSGHGRGASNKGANLSERANCIIIFNNNTVVMHTSRFWACSWCAGSVWIEPGLANDSSASTAYTYWGSLWGQTCCSVIDGKLQLKHASAAKKLTWTRTKKKTSKM